MVEDDCMEFPITIEKLSEKDASAIQDSFLLEITDTSLLSKINVPGFMQIAAAIGANASEVCRINISYDKLSKVKNDITKARAYVIGPDGKIIEHAKLDKFSFKLINVAVIMEVSSIIVGQYYMSQIDKKLKDIDKKLEKIIMFQKNEYKSKIIALVNFIRKRIKFKDEILKNDELRKRELVSLDRDEEECSKLLVQAILTVDDIIKGEHLKYDEYQKQVQEIETELMYQQILLAVLHEIADMKYAFQSGSVTKEYCYTELLGLTVKLNTLKKQLSNWHQKYIEKFHIISIDNSKKKLIRLKPPSGTTVAKKLMFKYMIQYFCDRNTTQRNWPVMIPDIVFDGKKIMNEFEKEAIPEKISQAIITQAIPMQEKNISSYDERELYKEDITLILKGGKVYYMPVPM